MKTRSIGIAVIGVRGLQIHVFQCRGHGLAFGRVGKIGRIGHAAADVGHLARRGSPGDLRLHLAGVENFGAVERRPRIAGQLPPTGDGGVEIGRRQRPPAQIGESLLVRSDQPGPGAGLDRHIADGHSLLHAQGADRLAACTRCNSRRRRWWTSWPIR